MPPRLAGWWVGWDDSEVEAIDVESGDLRRGILAPVCLGVGLVVTVILALLSDGPYQDDALTHFLYARWAWNNPAYLLDEWGRPGLTALLFPAARYGWTAARLVSALASTVSVWLALDIARRLNLARASWVPLFCYVQPLFLICAYTTLTETASALYLTAAIWCFVRRRPAWSAVLVSLCFVTRYELLVLLPIWVIALWRARGGWYCFALVLWAPLAHNLLGAVVLDRWPLAYLLTGSSGTDMYGQGGPLTMCIKSMATSGPPVAVLALVGLLLRRASRVWWLVPACYGVHLLAQSLIYWLGAFASGGYPRFLVTTSPLAALCAVAAFDAITGTSDRRQRRIWAAVAFVTALLALGLELDMRVADETWLFLIDKVRWPVRGLATVVLLAVVWQRYRPGRWPGVILGAVALIATTLPLGYLIRPHHPAAPSRSIAAAVRWLDGTEYADAPAVATNIWASHYLDRGFNLVPPDALD
ncbi:MAG: glycosyltransferase family 39 protein, partial [bacterium]|nr:glycosyltransferase family 39 protein [bacterium]